MAFKLNYLQVTIVQVASIWMVLRDGSAKKNTWNQIWISKETWSKKNTKDRKRERERNENYDTHKHHECHQHVLWLFRQNDHETVSHQVTMQCEHTRKRMQKRKWSQKKNFAQTKNTQMCEKKLLFIDGKMYQMQSIYNSIATTHQRRSINRTDTRQKCKELMMHRQERRYHINTYVSHEDSWQSQTHTIHQRPKKIQR